MCDENALSDKGKKRQWYCSFASSVQFGDLKRRRKLQTRAANERVWHGRGRNLARTTGQRRKGAMCDENALSDKGKKRQWYCSFASSVQLGDLKRRRKLQTRAANERVWHGRGRNLAWAAWQRR